MKCDKATKRRLSIGVALFLLVGASIGLSIAVGIMSFLLGVRDGTNLQVQLLIFFIIIQD